MAFDPRTGTLLIIEVKTRVDDLGLLERQLGRYERVAQGLARERGWEATQVITWLVLLASDESDAAIRMNRDVLEHAFPVRAGTMLAVVGGMVDPERDRRSLALIDPSSRRRDWLIRSRSDGRRSPAPYRDYADAANRLRSKAS